MSYMENGQAGRGFAITPPINFAAWVFNPATFAAISISQ